MLKTLDLPEVEYITSSEGKPKSVIVSIEDWQRITETLKILSSRELMQSIRRAKRQLSSKKELLSLETITKSKFRNYQQSEALVQVLFCHSRGSNRESSFF